MVYYSKTRRIPNRHLLAFSILLLLSIIVLYNHPYNNNLFNKLSKSGVDAILENGNTYDEDWHPPPRLRQQVKYVKGSTEGNELANRSWIQPRMLKVYVRPLDRDISKNEVFLYVTGVLLGNYGRKLSVVGCIIGDDVYEIVKWRGRMEVFGCHVPRKVNIGEFVSLVIRRDEYLESALKGERISNVEVKIVDDDIEALPNDVKLFIDDVEARDLVMIASNVGIEQVAVDSGSLKRRARYKVCMGTQLKTFASFAEDWIRYHRKLGVDMVYILDNDSVDDISKMVGDMNGVEVLYWPFQKSQTQAMSFLLVALRERCEWVLLCDVDEYVLIGIDENGDIGDIRSYVEGISRNMTQELLPFLIMGPSGHVKRPKGALAEEYIYKHVQQKRNGKVIARSDATWIGSGIHYNIPAEGPYVNMSGVENERPVFGDKGLLVHFQNRCLEDMIEKHSSGSGSVGDGHGLGVKKMGWPKVVPKTYGVVKEELRYTYFRDIWRIVLMRGEMKQVLVRDGIMKEI